MALQGLTISEALVVRYVNYGESDRIVAILTPKHGLCSGFAHGARNSKRRFGPALQLFSRINIMWQEGRYGSLRLFKEAELLEPAERVMPNLEAWALAAYASELVVALFPEEQAIPEVYFLLRSCFDALAQGEGLRQIRILYELHLLNVAGLLPHLSHCARCWCHLNEMQMFFDPEQGGALCSSCNGNTGSLPVSPLTLGSLARLSRLEMGKIHGVRLSPLTLEQGRTILDAALNNTLQRPLRSAPFIDLFHPLS
ncbi:MAG: DNA repair protein RecO [Desulfuromonadaceae bacterium]|nr:DNA repair protein RecO [Desulfuromonadaceae bacterium]